MILDRRRAIAAIAVAISVAATATPANAQPSGLDWRPCAQDATADCATLLLPIDHTDPKLGSFPLAVARRKATDPGKRIGVLMVNPGGPGGSGVSLAVGSNRLFGAEVLARFDVIGFDPRGVAASAPIRCSSELLGQNPGEPHDQAGFAALAAYNRKLSADCRHRSGPIFDHADTLSVVHDMDALRDALGERKVNFLGFSYGTQIGQQYAQLFGDRIRTMVLDGNMDHSLPLDRFLRTAAASGDDALGAFARWCESDTACALHGKDVLKHFDGLLELADQGALIEGGAGAASTWYVIQKVYGSLVQGDLRGLAQWLSTLRPGDAARSIGAGTSTHPRAAVFCQDWTPRIAGYADWQRIVDSERAAAPQLRYSSEAREAALSCIGWPRKANNPPAPVKFGPGPAILLVNPAHDPATGLAWAEGLHRQTANRTKLLRVDSIGHTAYPRTDCVRTAVEDYLVGQKVPERLTCP
ncbi:alpha/beta fold hydrolase [Amycolatopsis sp. cg5]|uniref:alpha/beta fold hydrolase n=1 Tax=Amycolatopsis sp. cg5 TaxID=3238802 RepID=UPI0035231A90